MDKFNKGDRVEYFAGGINHIPSCVGKTGTVTGADEYSTKGSWDDGMFFNVDTKNLRLIGDGLVVGKEYELLPKPKYRRVGETEAKGAVFFSSDVTRVRVESKSIFTGEQGNYNVKALNGSSKNYTQAVHKSFLRPVSDAVVDDNQKIKDFWKVGAVVEFTVDGTVDASILRVGCKTVDLSKVVDKVRRLELGKNGAGTATVTFRTKLVPLVGNDGTAAVRWGPSSAEAFHIEGDALNFIKDVKLITPAPEPEKKYTVELTKSEVEFVRKELGKLSYGWETYLKFSNPLKK